MSPLNAKAVVVAPILARYDAISSAVLDTCRLLGSIPGVQPEILTTFSDLPDVRARVVPGLAEVLLDPAFLAADLLVYHFGLYNPLFDLLLVGNGRAKQVVRFHNVTPAQFLRPQDASLIERSLDQMSSFRNADAIWADSATNARALREHGIVEPAAEAIPLVVDAPERATLFAKRTDAIEILFLGRFVRSKGVLDLLRAVSVVARRGGAPFRLRLAGNQAFSHPEYLREVAQAAAELGGRVELLGAVDDATRDRLLHEAHILAIPSYHEGFCKPVVEGLRAGCIPVGYYAYNLPDICAGLGRLVPPGDIEALADALSEIVEDVAAVVSAREDRQLRLDRGPTGCAELASLVDEHVRRFEVEAIRDLTLASVGRLLRPRDGSGPVGGKRELMPSLVPDSMGAASGAGSVAKNSGAGKGRPGDTASERVPHPVRSRAKGCPRPAAGASTVVLDMRCLQDPNYAERGVGRHARALVEHGARRRGLRLVGMVDEGLPSLPSDLDALLTCTVPNAYAALAASGFRPGCFVSLSPMTHDPLWTARLMGDPRWLRAAVVYDFIPRREPERYLPTEAARLRYAAGLSWLARSDVFAPISRSASQDLLELLGARAGDVVVTGAPVNPALERARAMGSKRRGRHVLVIGGRDPRKDPETVIRAHARAPGLQSGAGVPLAIVGNYGEAEAAAFRAIAVEAGGRAELVEVPGHVSEAALLDAYASAIVVVSASRDEGFSLPVVEGMAAGLPALVSDIPAHRELVEDPALRFPVGDDRALSPLLERVAADGAWRRTVVARQSAVWPRFQAEQVAGRFWDLVLGRLPSVPPAVLRGRRPRVALLSPLPPDQSGVADYTAATCSELGKLVELEVFTETEGAVHPSATRGVRPLTALPHLLPGFDRVVSVVGNSHFHVRIFELLERYGSACIAHDARMLGFYRAHCGLERTLALAGRELGRPVGEAEVNGWIADEGRLEALFLGEIVERATPCIVHSPVTARLCEERYGRRPAYLPFCIYRPWAADELRPAAREEARMRLGLEPGEVAVVTFGSVHPTKAPQECVLALDLLRGKGVPASLHFVGDCEHMPDHGAGLRALIDRLGLTGRVRFARGFVPERTYRDYLVGADLGIQVRTYGLGGLSGALLDCAAAGLPTVTNESLGAAVGPPATYVRWIPDSVAPPLLAEALGELVHAGPSAAQREADRRAFSAERSFEGYAHGLCRALGLEIRPVRAGTRPEPRARDLEGIAAVEA